MSGAPDASRLVWVDLETTGLDPSRERILEIAVVITDGDLEVKAERHIILHQHGAVLDSMDAWCKEHHTASGLLALSGHSRLHETDASVILLSFLRTHALEGQSPLCGNSVHFDRGFLATHLPAVNKYLHYRNLDVSTVKELVRRWYPDVYASRPGADSQSPHRAMLDIQNSITELRHYRQHAFLPRKSQ